MMKPVLARRCCIRLAKRVDEQPRRLFLHLNHGPSPLADDTQLFFFSHLSYFALGVTRMHTERYVTDLSVNDCTHLNYHPFQRRQHT